MGRTNYSLNEMLNSVTKRAFNRYTSQTVDYQHLEAATTTTGLVSNRREYSSASILADTFSLNAQNIVESNYDPFLKVNVNSVITSKTPDIHDVGLSSCTDDGRFLAVTETNTDNVRVYEFDNSLVDKKLFSSSGTINLGFIETMDVDMNGDGSETFVAKKVGTTQVVVDKFDQGLNSVSSTTLLTTVFPLIEASISVSENGVRVAVTATSNHPFLSLPFLNLFLQVHDNLNTNEYYSLYVYYEVTNTPSVLMSRNGRIVVVNSGGTVITFEIPSASPGGVVSLSGSGHTQNMGIDKFDLSYDGKVMLTHSGSNASIYIWNGLEWKQFGQTISTGLSGNIVSVAISEYAEYFVVASSDQIKVYKLNSVYEQYGTIISGDFGSSGHKICISKTGDTVVIGNSQMASSYGRAYMYTLKNETTWLLVDQINGSVDTNTSYVLDYVNVYNPYYRSGDGIRDLHNGGHWTNNNGLFFQTNAPFIRLTDNTEYNTNSGIRIPVTFGSKWSVNFKWHLDNNHVSDGSSMSFIFFAPNAPTSTFVSQHGGYRVSHNFKGGSETHKIKNPSGNSLTNNSVSYGHSGSAGQAFPPWGASEYKTVTVSYDNGVLFTRVTNTPDSFLNNGYYTTFTGSDLEAQRALWGTQTYIAFGGNTGGWYGDDTGDGATAGYTSFQYIKDFHITQESNPDNLGKYVRISNSGDKILIGLQNQLLFKTSSLVKIAAGWEQQGGTITSIDTLSLSLSNDGNYLVIGVSDSVKIFKFSQGSWSQYSEIIANDLQFMDFGKYVSITMSGSKVAVGSDKNSIVRVYEPHNVGPVLELMKNVVDTISLTPQSSLLEMSGDGNRLLTGHGGAPQTTLLQGLTVVSTPSGNKYSLDGVTQPTLYLKKGVAYMGIQASIQQFADHPLKISATPDGTHGGDNTIIAGTESTSGGMLLIPTSPASPDILYYFCPNHPNMGGMIIITRGLSIWDKNEAGIWGYREELTEGDVIQLSNNGDYLSVDYSNIARLYGIDSDGVVSKIGDDITATTVGSGAGVFRTFTPTHINTGVSDSGSLILASYQDATRAVEICSLTWDPGPSTQLSVSTQSSEITGFGAPTVGRPGIVLSRNGQTLIVYDDQEFQVYTYDGTQWNYIRTKINTCHDVAISYDGTVLACKGDNHLFLTHLFIESAVSGTSMGEIDVDPTTFAFKSNNTLAVCIPNQDIKLYNYVNNSWVLSNEIAHGYSSPFTEAHAKWSGDGTRLAVGDANAERVSFYEYDNSIGWTLHSFITGGGNTLEDFGSVVDLSNDGNTVLVGAPGDGTSSYRGYIKVYDYVSSAWTLRHTITASGTSDVNFGKSVSLSSDGNRIGYVFDNVTQVTNNTTESIVINSSYSSGVSTNNGGSWGNLISLDSANISLTNSSDHPSMTDNGVWFPVTFGSEWSIAFDWWVDNNSSNDGDEMRVVFYAPNQPSSSNGSQHGGYNVYHFFGSSNPESQQIKTPTDSSLVSRSVAYGSSTNSYGFSLGFNKRVTISYNNGVLFTRVTGTDTADLNNGYSYTFTGSHLNAQQALWGTQTYMAISGKTQNQASSQYIRNIDISWDGETTTTTTYSQASIRDNVGGTLINPVDSNSDLVNVSEERELSAMSMSYDGTQYGIRATSGSYDAVVKVGQSIVNGWTKRGHIMSFSYPTSTSFASNSKRDMSVSSDGNMIAFGKVGNSNIRVKVWGFSNGYWSTRTYSGGYKSDIYPGGSGTGNPTAISVDLSSDGMTLATLSSYSDHVAEAKTYSYSSGGWVQLGSTINFVETGSNTIKISGDGTTLALGNHAPDSSINSVRVYRMGSTDWEIVSPPMHLSAMNPSNFFGAGLNLTNDGSTLTTFNNSGVEFSNFTTQSVVRPSQYLNDITVSGATIDMGGIRFSDSGDSLFIMSGDSKVRVYDSNHNIEIDHGWVGLDTFSSTKDGNSMVLCGEYGYTKVFNRSNGTWSLLLGTPFNTNVTDPVVDIKSGGNSLVFVAPGHDLRVYGYENGSWSQVTTSSGTRGTSVAITDTDMIVVDNKTFQIEDQFQDNSFSAPTLSLNGDSYIRLDFGSPYIESGATITTTASITPGVVISGEVFNEEPGIYTIKYEAEDLLRKKAVPIFRTVEVLPKLPIIKLNGDRVIYHTLGTQLIDPGVTTSIPVNVYHRFANQTTVVTGFPKGSTVGEYKVFYTNDTTDKYLRTSSMVSRTINVRARPVLNLVGGSTVYNPLGETYIDPGVTVSGAATVSFKKPNVNLSQIQTIKYTAKDEFGIEAVPITRQVIVSERPTITTSGTLFRILNDPLSIPTPTVKPVELTSSLNSSNNININQSGTYTITYNVSDSNNIPANQERQSYQVGSYGELSVTKTGYLSNLSKNGRNLAVFNTDIQTYGKELDGSWSNNGFITTPNGSVVTSMKFTSNGSHLVFGMASHLTIGLVRVYKRNTSFVNGWEQVGLDLFGVDYQGKFGHAVDINNDATRIIVSAPEANTNSGTILKAGSLKIYDLQENFWIQQTQIIEGLGASELLGTSISMSTDGNIIAMGSPGYANTTVSGNSVTSVNVGKTTVYSYTDNAWGRVGNVIEDGTIEKRNGFSISLSNDGTTIAIGSENGGGVRVYRFVSNSWIPFGSHISGTFGKSVSLSGNTVVIGSEAENNGRVYIYTYRGDDWSLLGDTFEKVIVAEGGTNDMGKFVTISDDRTLLSVVSQSDVRVYSI